LELGNLNTNTQKKLVDRLRCLIYFLLAQQDVQKLLHFKRLTGISE
jgi:hypothetical protein